MLVQAQRNQGQGSRWVQMAQTAKPQEDEGQGVTEHGQASWVDYWEQDIVHDAEIDTNNGLHKAVDERGRVAKTQILNWSKTGHIFRHFPPVNIQVPFPDVKPTWAESSRREMWLKGSFW